MNRTIAIASAALIFGFSGALPAAEPAVPPADAAALRELNMKLLDKLSPALVEVEYFFRPDENGERPEFTVGYLCPGCNSMHQSDASSYLEDQKPLTTPGYAIAPDEFIASDSQVRPDWLETLDVVFKNKRYPGTVVEYYPERRSVKIRTAEPIPGIEPLKFQPDSQGRRYGFFLVRESGIPLASVRPWSDTKLIRNLGSGKDYLAMQPNTLIVNDKGEVLALSMTDQLQLGADRLAPPGEWKKITAADYEKMISEFSKQLSENLYAVEIRLKPIKQASGFAALYSRSDRENRNEVNGFALKLTDGRLLIAAKLTPAETARISQISLIVGDKEVPAVFEGSLKHYGALVAKPEQPLPGKGIALFGDEMAKVSGQEGFIARVKSFGRKLDVRIVPAQANEFDTGFRGVLTPEVPNAQTDLLFLSDGKLLALPLSKRRLDSDYDSRETVSAVLAAKLLQEFDPINVPQQGEAKIAWLGVEFQKLNTELARANNVAEFTNDGKNGLLVTGVYPDSPAEKMGLKTGDILLSITPEGSAKPERFDEYQFDTDRMPQFPWAQYDSIPQQYYEEIPPPWGTTRNGLNNLFSKIGIGAKAKLSVLSNGKVSDHNLVISAAPESFDSTEKFNDPTLGLTACDLTYEVRNYFQFKPEEQGVLVAKVKAGGRAAVAGIKPYEIIVSVDGEPVKNLESFRKQLEGKTELKIGVRRLAVTRIVTLNLAEKK